MTQALPIASDHGVQATLRGMFAARKEVFIDLLKWDLPALAGQFELDHFDTPHAEYVILTDLEGRHAGSARLLPTERPHILSDLFWFLCDGPIPTGPRTMEITRFCLDRRLRASDRRSVRNQLVTALAQHALQHGITDYTGVAEKSWFEQILNFGWECRPLGRFMQHEGRALCALHIRIDEETLPGLRRTGVYEEPILKLTNCEGVTL